MTSIPDLTETEQHTVQTTADERWGEGVAELPLADVELALIQSVRSGAFPDQ